MRRATIVTAAPSKVPDWLTSPIEFEDMTKIRLRRNSMRIIVALVAGLLVWSAVAPIRELSIAHGQLVPLYEVRSVQHLEGGIVDEILVNEGQLVDKGQPLMRLQPAGMESELATLRVRAHNLSLEKMRAEALLAHRDMDTRSLGDISADLIANHVQVHQLRLEQRTKEHEVLNARIAQKKAEIAGLESQIPMQHRLIEMQKERLEGRQKLLAIGAMSKKQVLEVESLYEQARIQLRESERKLAMAKEELPEAEVTLGEADAKARKLWSEELAKSSSELAEVQESIRKNADQVDRLVVRSPIRGRVQNMVQRSPGEVVPPGETILRIVPVGDALVAEVQVIPEDIAEVTLGDRADIKVSAFDYSRYGKLKGEVTSISPTTFETDDHKFYYKALIRLDPKDSTAFAPYARLQPGMTVDADIISGSKSLLRYMLKPVFRGIDVAFTER
jgi:HlyD family secretion protein/adhesin transport system membrane fusion protein